MIFDGSTYLVPHGMNRILGDRPWIKRFIIARNADLVSRILEMTEDCNAKGRYPSLPALAFELAKVIDMKAQQITNIVSKRINGVRTIESVIKPIESSKPKNYHLSAW